jgi:hypothetical protein
VLPRELAQDAADGAGGNLAVPIEEPDGRVHPEVGQSGVWRRCSGQEVLTQPPSEGWNRRSQNENPNFAWLGTARISARG